MPPVPPFPLDPPLSCAQHALHEELSLPAHCQYEVPLGIYTCIYCGYIYILESSKVAFNNQSPKNVLKLAPLC